MFNIDWYGMLKIEYDNGWMSYENLKLLICTHFFIFEK